MIKIIMSDEKEYSVDIDMGKIEDIILESMEEGRQFIGIIDNGVKKLIRVNEIETVEEELTYDTDKAIDYIANKLNISSDRNGLIATLLDFRDNKGLIKAILDLEEDMDKLKTIRS